MLLGYISTSGQQVLAGVLRCNTSCSCAKLVATYPQLVGAAMAGVRGGPRSH